MIHSRRTAINWAIAVARIHRVNSADQDFFVSSRVFVAILFVPIVHLGDS